ncbi:MAG: TonB-dependent receptor [Bacteroidota bacterium]|nr:TonB-dependent receptor [Bacteroidota bacterium]
MKKIYLIILAFFASIIVYPQEGFIRGKITDAATGEELIGAAALIEKTFLGSSADLDGNYNITNVPAGVYELRCSYISYETQVITGVEVREDEVTLLDIKLNPVSLGLEEVIVTAKAVRNTESAMLTMQKKSANLVDGISSQQITKSGDNDAAEAVGRVTGISVEGGKYVYVRGLGDRYSLTTLNGCAIPSLDPERNSVEMDLFPTNVIDNIVVYKSYSPFLSPFTGGLIDIQTKDFPEKLVLRFSISMEYNLSSSLNDDFLTYEGGKLDWLGVDDGTRDFPVNPAEIPLYPIDRDAIDDVTRSFNKIMEPNTRKSFLNSRINFSVGNQIKLFGKPLGFNFGLSYNTNYNYYDDGERGYYKLTQADATALTTENKYNETAGERNTLTSILGNLNYKFSDNHKMGLVLLYNRSGSKTAFYQYGQKPSDEIGMFIQSRELGFQERSIMTSQLKGEHFFESAAKLRMSWIVSYSLSKLDEPDLRFFTNSYYPDAVGDARFEINPSKYKEPSRFHRNMNENNIDSKLNFELPFTFLGDASKFKFGGAYTYVTREFREEKVNYLSQIQYYNGSVSDYLDDSNIGQSHPAFDPATNENYGLYLQDATDKRNSYDGFQHVIAGYALVDLPIGEKIKMELGARFEKNYMETVSKQTNLEKGVLNDADILPSINFTWLLRENMNVRLACTRTLSRPTFREIAPFASFSPVSPTIVGNPDLNRTLIDNVDLRYEYFIRSGEIFSFGLFFKNFIDPIEMVDNPIAVNPEISFQNVENARNYGFETEFRKRLDFMDLDNFSLGLNFSYIRSEVSIDPVELESIRALDPDQPDTRPLFGQAPFIVNALLSYASDKIGLSANLVYNVTGERISLVTKGGTPDVFLQPMHLLDFNLTQSLSQKWQLRIKAQNLLNSLHSEVFRYKDRVYAYYVYSPSMSFSLGVVYDLK